MAAHPGRLHVEYVVSRGAAAGGDEPADLPPGVSVGRIDKARLQGALPPADCDGSSRVLVCGPGGLLRALCGPKAEDGGAVKAAKARKPPLGGVLRELGYRDEQVDWL